MDHLHRTRDDQSLQLTRAALERLAARPEPMDRIRATLGHWDRVASPSSKPLRDEWRRMLDAGDWTAALGPGDRGQQIGQASPRAGALDAQTR